MKITGITITDGGVFDIFQSPGLILDSQKNK